MRTSMLDEAPSQATSPVSVRRHRRSTIIVATGAVTLLAVTAGAAVALVSRPAPTRPAVAAGPAGGPAATPTTAGVNQGPTPATSAAGAPAAATTPASQAAEAPRPVLADGTYPAFIRKIDVNRRTMVIDVIQVFEREAAAQAAIQDGRNPEDAQYVDFYIRNQNSRLRTLPVARDASIKFLVTCEGPTATREVLSELAKNATTSEAYYYTLTVKDGSVRRIVEHMAQPAC